MFPFIRFALDGRSIIHQLMVALAGFAGKRVTPVRRLGAAACEGELL